MLIYEGWISQLIHAHPGIVGVVIIGGLLLMFIASVVRALQRWEILPDPLLPEKWRNRWYRLQRKGLEMSAEEKTYGAIARGMSGGGSNARKDGGELSIKEKIGP